MKKNRVTPVTKHRSARPASLLFVMAFAACQLFGNPVSGQADSDRKNRKIPESSQSTRVETCEVENFGKVNDHFYRGAQPEEGQYDQLKRLGVRTVIDLRDDPKVFAKTRAEAAGLQYINLPMSDKKYPSQEKVAKFLEFANDAGNWPIFVHCAGGRHRTGAMTAVYRMAVEGWEIDRAYNEMKVYDFYTRWGHKEMKTFVYDYAKDLQAGKRRPFVTETTVVAPNRDN